MAGSGVLQGEHVGRDLQVPRSWDALSALLSAVTAVWASLCPQPLMQCSTPLGLNI